MSRARPVSVEFTAEERTVVRSSLRESIRKTTRTRAALIGRFGADADTTSKDVRLALLVAAYRKLDEIAVDSARAPGVPFTEEPKGG